MSGPTRRSETGRPSLRRGWSRFNTRRRWGSTTFLSRSTTSRTTATRRRRCCRPWPLPSGPSALQIATAVLVLPIWNPLRLAEEVAVLDNLSGGRFICGIGRGYQPHEMSRFDIDLPDSRQIFLESLDVMVKAWTQDESLHLRRRVRQGQPPDDRLAEAAAETAPQAVGGRHQRRDHAVGGQVGHDAHYDRPAGRERRAVPPDLAWCTR